MLQNWQNQILKPVLILPIPSKMSNASARQAEIAGNMQMIPSDTSVCDTRCRDKDIKPLENGKLTKSR